MLQISRKAFNVTNRNVYPKYDLLSLSFCFYLSVCLEIFLVCRKYLVFAKKKKYFNVTRIWNTRTHPYCPSYFYYVYLVFFSLLYSSALLYSSGLSSASIVVAKWWIELNFCTYILICENERKHTIRKKWATKTRSAFDKKIRFNWIAGASGLDVITDLQMNTSK